MDCHMPQSFRGSPSTKIVAATAGFVRTRSEPCTTNTPSWVVVTPAGLTGRVAAAGAGAPYDAWNDTRGGPVAWAGGGYPAPCPTETVSGPAGTARHRPQWFAGAPSTEIVDGTAGCVVT